MKEENNLKKNDLNEKEREKITCEVCGEEITLKDFTRGIVMQTQNGWVHTFCMKNEDEMQHYKNDKPNFVNIINNYLNKDVILDTWVTKGMRGKIVKVDKVNKIFVFYNSLTKKKSTYGITIIRGITEV